MDHDREITSLTGETVALQAIVSRVLHEIGQVDPRVRHAIRVGFDEAANQLDAMAIAAGGKTRPEHFAKAIKLLEVLRFIVLKRDEPTPGEVLTDAASE
jgi:hypothetical protein